MFFHRCKITHFFFLMQGVVSAYDGLSPSDNSWTLAACTLAFAVMCVWYCTPHKRPSLLVCVCMHKKVARNVDPSAIAALVRSHVYLFPDGSIKVVGDPITKKERSDVCKMHTMLTDGLVFNDCDLSLRSFRALVESSVKANRGGIASMMDVGALWNWGRSGNNLNPLAPGMVKSHANRLDTNACMVLGGLLIYPNQYPGCNACRDIADKIRPYMPL